MATDRPNPGRIASLDQFRGYTVAGMFLVNFVGAFAATPALLQHHNSYCSYADTIMPQFFFAVGFAYRLTFGRRAQTEGVARAYARVVRRFLGLALLAMVIYTAPVAAQTWQQLQQLGPAGALRGAVRDWFQTLMHIAVTSLWILPVIRAGAAARILYMLGSAALQIAASNAGYFEWVQAGGIDGGVLGFLAWTIPTIIGTLACDAVLAAGGSARDLAGLFAWSAALMLAGWLLSCGTTLYDIRPGFGDSDLEEPWAADPVIPRPERWQTHALAWAEPPFVPPPPPQAREENYWMMSQRAGSVSYQIFAAGLSLAVYAAFVLVCDVWGWRLGVFRTLGVNALVGYVLHGIVDDAVKAFVPHDSPGWYVAAAFGVYFGITYLFLRKLERDGIFLKL